MPRHAKTRIVGTIAAIPLSILWFGTATSQSTVSNDQSQVGDIFSSQTLNVVTNTSDTTATTTSTGNSFVGSVVTGNLAVTSGQTVSGNVSAGTTVNVTTDTGPNYVSTTAATANSGKSIISGGGTLSGTTTQTTTSTSVDSETETNGPDANSTDAQVSTQAIANSQTYGTTNSTISSTVNQSNSSTVTANGGAVLGDVSDQGSFSAVAAANNLTSVGAGQATQNLTVDQTNNAPVTQGAMFVNLGNSEVTSTAASASGNNANVSNTEGSLTVTGDQDNQSFVHAQAVETSYEYGGANVSADGVGNAMFAGNAGPSLTLSNTQTNGTQGVESTASFTSEGSPGYDAFATSTASGNAVTGFSCSACGGVMNVTNSQTNLGDASATTTIGVSNGARSVRGVATAVGNTATFYVSSPSD